MTTATLRSAEEAADEAPDTERDIPALPGVGTVIADRYRVEGVIGSGGMGHVLAARHIELGHVVAIKLLDPVLACDQEYRERFAREGRTMAGLRSEFSVRVHDVGELDSGMPFMVMDHLEGMDLRRVLAESGPLPLADLCLWIEQACEALEEAHAKGIVHRDVKPENIFIARTEGTSSVRVLDFGIALSLSKGLGNISLTRTGDIIGTLPYMAPEQICDSKSVDPRSDIWSIGACLYRLATGVRPFTAVGEVGMVEAILFRHPRPLHELREGVPFILETLVARCLAKHPEDRFAHMGELRAALRSARAALAAPAGPPLTQGLPPSPPSEPISLPMKRSSRSVAVVGALAVAVTVIAGVLDFFAMSGL